MGTNQAYFSPEWKSQIGYEPDEMPNMYEEWKKRLHPDDRDRVIDTLRDYIEGKNSGYIVEFRLQHKDGSYRWMSAQGELVAGTSRMMGCHIDITERKLAEEALQREKEFAENLVDTAQAIVLVLDPEGRIVRFNPYMEDISGYTLKEMQGRDWFTTFLPGNDQDRIHSIFAQAISDTQTSGNVNSILTKDGSERFIEWYDKTLKDADGHIVGILAIGQDVTERMRTEEELKQTLEDLKRSNQALEQFAYIVSHDLQEPLRMVASYVQLLEKRYKDHLDQDANDFIKFAVDGAIRMQQMILDILEYSRVGTKDQSFKKVDLNSVLSQVIASLGGQIEVSGALVTSDKLPTVLADEMQIAQLFQNLLGNAIKFRGESTPQIHISCEADNGDWVTSVKDNGIGIPQEFQDRIFAVFRKLHAIGQYPGSGIGLAISAKIVERHGGRIWVESEPEKGSTFFFTIPK
ncbi:MAG: PAS domain S-box protein [Chloroflexi bacterium]|nr:PAS domain S-box protein [Chloroflexota bacterium]